MARFVSKQQGFLSVLWDEFSSLDPLIKMFMVTAILIVGVTPYIINNYQSLSQHAATTQDCLTNTSYNCDLRSYYPNTDLYQNYYLTGYNYLPNSQSPSAAVLWFKQQDQYTFYQYNSSPTSAYSTCHYDQLSWWNDGFLRYIKTVDACPGHPPNEIDYGDATTGPIIFLPRNWNPSITPSWSLSGKSDATYIQNGVVMCTGINSWTAQIVGIETISPGEKGIHWSTTQTTKWTGGPGVAGGCYPGYTTNWKEDYWLTGKLPLDSTKTAAKGLKRTKGGNQNGAGNWDIWFDKWTPLP